MRSMGGGGSGPDHPAAAATDQSNEPWWSCGARVGAASACSSASPAHHHGGAALAPVAVGVDSFPRPLRRLPFALAAGPGVEGLDPAQFLHQLLLRPRLRRFLRFHGMRQPREMGSAEVNAFLTHLAVDLQVSPST